MAHADKIGLDVFVSSYGIVQVPEKVLAVYEIANEPVKPKRKSSKRKWKEYRKQRRNYKWRMRLFNKNMEAICCHQWMMGGELEIS